HVPLNQHLYRLSSTNTPLCPGCLDAEGTVQHFVCVCPDYDEARHTLHRAIGRAFYSITYLLS
ncbi:hypothetical protein K488DRAFT_13024, partial [Vararia minispora EC-137]